MISAIAAGDAFPPVSNAIIKRMVNSGSLARTPAARSPRTKRIGLAALTTLFWVVAQQAFAQQTAPQFEDLAGRAAAARNENNLPLAIQLYAQAEDLRPDWAEGWFYLGLLQYTVNQYPPAIEAFNHLLQLQPAAAPAMALRGLCEFETGAYDDSLRDLAQAVARGAANEPRNAQVIRFHLAQLLARAGRYEEALSQYRFFALLPVDDPDLMAGLGLAGMHVKTLVKDVSPADRELYEAVGKAGFTFLSGDPLTAGDLFTQVFARYPTALNVHLFYGTLLYLDAPDLAVDQFQSEVALAPANASARAMLAFTLLTVRRYREALAEAEHAYAAQPDLEIAQIALGRSLAQSGDVQRAAALLKAVLQRDPNNLEAHLGMVAVYSRVGRREDAYRERMLCLGLGK